MHRCINLLDSLEAISLSEQASERQYQPFSSKIAVIKTTRECISAKAELNNDLAPRINLKFQQH